LKVALLIIVLSPLSLLAQNPDWTFLGAQEDSWHGYSVAEVGDLNGDGYADLAVSAPFYEDGELAEGAVFIFYNSANGLSSAPSWTAQSNQAGSFFGWSVAEAGDVNGDGFSDLLIGAPNFSDDQDREGAVFLWYGGPNGLGPAGIPANADWTAQLNQTDAHFGYALASAGDTNNDGYDDLVVGAPFFSRGQDGEGLAALWLGSASGMGQPGAFDNADWIAEGNVPHATFGASLSSAGDQNRDYHDDLLVGAPGMAIDFQLEGAAFLFKGDPSGLEISSSWSVRGQQDGALLGSDVQGLGDIDFDGYADVAVSAPHYTNGQYLEGAVFVWNGSPNLSAGIRQLNTANWSKESNQAGARMGSSISSIDFNADGLNDLIVGLSHHDGAFENQGQSRLYLSSASGLASSPSFTVNGIEENQFLGSRVAGLNGSIAADQIVTGSFAFLGTGQDERGKAQAHGGSSPELVDLSLDLWLSGPFASTNMRTDLSDAGLVPRNHPYDELPWNYFGAEEVSIANNNNIVDWILVELRSNQNESSTVSKTVGLLHSNGKVEHVNGGPLLFENTAVGSYYLVVRHRNHLGVMSASSRTFNSTGNNYNFQNASNSAFGTSPMHQLPNGDFALWAGDVLSDGKVVYAGSSNDRVEILSQAGGPSPFDFVNGYLLGDTNLDGKVSYSGSLNDRVIVLESSGGPTPFDFRLSQIPD